MGGGDLIASFLDAQAIDEFVISVAPVFIGDGIPLIARRHRHVSLELLSIERFEDGLVQSRYRVQGSPASEEHALSEAAVATAAVAADVSVRTRSEPPSGSP